MMNADVEFHIRQNYSWTKLPANVKQGLGNSQKEYEKAIISFSVKNQLRYKGNLVRHVKKDEKRYYEDLLNYSREHLMLYPYHLSDVMVKGLRVTPFGYYINIITDIMGQEKSYDSLPNFTAADCLRLLGIGRNQYIDLMNQCRSSKKFFRRKPIRDLLPVQPVEDIVIEPWWYVQPGYITEDDVKVCATAEKKLVDTVIDRNGQSLTGELDYRVLHSLYRKGLIYLDVPVADDDYITVPPLEGFVMNRVLGDYFETLLYKIFVSIDEHTTVAELASVLQIDLQLVKNAVSMYCRLGYAKKKNVELDFNDFHPSWKNWQQHIPDKKPTPDQLLIDWTTTLTEPAKTPERDPSVSPDNSSSDVSEMSLVNSVGHSKRIAFLFDSTLTAFLMMGNLSPGLKSHAVTMFEVGKLSDESLDSFLAELEKVDSVAEGEAQRYFDHAITLRHTIRFLRYNKDLALDAECGSQGLGLDLLRCESLLGLEPATCARVLNKNYQLLVSMAPLSNEIQPVSSCTPQHVGPAIPEVNSVWFKLFIYQLTGFGPPSLLLVKGTKLRKLPAVFQDYDRLLVTTWGHDPGVIATSNIMLTLNDALQHSAVLVQGYGWNQMEGETCFVSFPFTENEKQAEPMCQHVAIQALSSILDVNHTCGYITLLKSGKMFQPPSFRPRDGESPSRTPSQSSRDHSHSASPQPKNGIKDTECAKVLATELDSLEIEEKLNEDQPEKTQKLPPGVCDRNKLTLAVGDRREELRISTTHSDLNAEWTLLDCSYGIPLFDAKVNETVCQRIASRGLFKTESLDKLLHSSRRLALKLLNFITEHQDLSVVQEGSSSESGIGSSDATTEHNVPFPTHNLLFTNGSVSPWNSQ